MSTTGVYLLATTGAEGVLFRHTTGLAYDTLAVQYASLVYLIQCATGGTPAWHVSPCQVPTWSAWLISADCVRAAYWVPVDAPHRPAVARFVAATCLSTPAVWTGWSEALLGIPLPSALPSALPSPLSPWEQLCTPAPAPSSLTKIAEHVDAWTHALDHGVPPVMDLNALLVLLGRPPRTETTSVGATLAVLPPDAPRTLLVPTTSNVVTLWHPCLDGFSYTEVEGLSALLHTPDYLNNPHYDELRQVCQKKLGAPTKRWLTHS